MEQMKKLKQWIAESNRIVFFGGAGVSTESGIPDFRSVDGLYNQKFEYPPETIISKSFYKRRPEYFFNFYREKMLPLGFEPNITHKVLARWEEEGKLSAVVTQNIDGLHQKAGSKKVYELHGSVLRNYCAITASGAANSILLNLSGTPKACLTVTAAVSSSPMWCSTKRVWTATPSKRAWVPLPLLTCSSWRAQA